MENRQILLLNYSIQHSMRSRLTVFGDYICQVTGKGLDVQPAMVPPVQSNTFNVSHKCVGKYINCMGIIITISPRLSEYSTLAQQCIPMSNNNENRTAQTSVVLRLWEAQ